MRITGENIKDYIQSEYGAQVLKKENSIKGFKPLLQKNYGGPNDCTLTSITAVLNHITNYKNTVQLIYNHVEAIAQNNFYEIDGNGTWSPAIRTIFNESAKKYTKRTSCVNYGKGIGYDYDYIKKEIDEGNPIVLSMHSDGLDGYKNHSVTIVGYKDYGDAKMIQIYDNWYSSHSYIDYDKLSTISSTHCLSSKSYPILDWLWKLLVSIFGKKQ